MQQPHANCHTAEVKCLAAEETIFFLWVGEEQKNTISTIKMQMLPLPARRVETAALILTSYPHQRFTKRKKQT